MAGRLPQGNNQNQYLEAIYPEIKRSKNRRMKMEHVYAVRIQRLRQLMDDDFGGKQSALANRLGRQADYISRIFTGRRMLAEDLAREFEEVLGKPAYWLDNIASGEGQWPFPGIAPADYAALPAEDQSELLMLVRSKVARYVRKSPAAA